MPKQGKYEKKEPKTHVFFGMCRGGSDCDGEHGVCRAGYVAVQQDTYFLRCSGLYSALLADVCGEKSEKREHEGL